MSIKGKVPVAILIILLVSLLSVGAGFYLLQQERTKTLALTEELESVKMKQKITETKLEESQNKVSALEQKSKEAQEQIDKLTGELQQQKTAKQEALDQLAQLKIDLEGQKKIKSGLENKLTQAQKNLEETQAKLNELDSKKAELEKKVNELEEQAKQAQAQTQGVELGKIVVNPEGAAAEQTATEVVAEKPKEAAAVSSLKGKVLVINKDYNFAVINLGSKDGVNLGDVFSVYHNNKYIGDVKIEKIHDSMSAAGFAAAEMKDKVSEGDKVVQKTK